MTNKAGFILIGVDTGGTFTDFVAVGDEIMRTAKVLSTPDDPARAILEGLKQLGIAGSVSELVHGTTVGTNAVLEGKGARVAFITNRGFGDLLSLARQNRDALYSLEQPRVPEPVPEEYCLETGGRIGADAQILEPLETSDLKELATAIRRLEPESVAINLLFSFLRPDLEERIAAALPDGLPVSLSSKVLPEIREYERGIATWLNATVGPRLSGYLERLATGMESGRLAVMQSDGTTVQAAQAAGRAVHLLLSGPAGGLAAAGHIGKETGEARLLTFDMGGTSTDVALVEGSPRLTREGRIGRYPVAIPMVDMHTIGAGGGSIARVDAGGLLRVGPESAGADPGPVCYGRGGEAVTVTDANLVLGRIPPGVRLGGEYALDLEAAGIALEGLAGELGVEREQAAHGVIRVANEHMSRALRVMSAERGLDPQKFCLMSFGGAGGLHVCALAESLGIRRALVPARAGVLSALGMLVAEPGRQFTAGFLRLAGDAAADDLEAGFSALEEQARLDLGAEGLEPGKLRMARGVECRYRGQETTLLLEADIPAGLAEAFHRRHEGQYGHALDLPVELVNLRLDVRGPRRLETIAAPTVDAPEPARETRIDGEPVPVCWRQAVVRDRWLRGPAIVLDSDATTWVAPGWKAQRDEHGHLRLEEG